MGLHHFSDFVPARRLALEKRTPKPISRLVRRCLERDARLRLRDIGEARIAITSYLAYPAEDRGIEAPSLAVGRTLKQKLLRGGVLAAVILLAMLAGWLLKQSPPASNPIRLRSNVTSSQPLFTFLGSPVALSDDGKLLAYVEGTFGTRHLYFRSLDHLEPKLLEGTEYAHAPFFSPDGQWVGFFKGLFPQMRDAQLMKVSLSGGTPLTLCSVEVGLGATWGSDGTIVFAQFDAGLMKVSVGGGTPEKVTRLEEGEESHTWPQFLPGGRFLLFVSNTSSDSRVEVLDVSTGQRKMIHQGGEYPRYTPSGHLLYSESGTVFAAPFDLEHLEMVGEPVPVLQDVMVDTFGAAYFSVSGDGTLVYQREAVTSERALVWVDEKGAITPASKSQRAYQQFHRLSPDGKRVAVVILSDENTDIWVVDLERDLQTRLTFDEASDQYPVWSPDGRWIYFRSTRQGKRGIFRKASDGSSEAEMLLEGAAIDQVRAVSPDGKYLAYCPSSQENGSDIFLLPLEGDSSPQPLLRSPNNEGSPKFSPDGRWLAYDSDESGEWVVYIRRLPGPSGKWQVSPGRGFRPRWSQDGRRLFYRTDEAIWVCPVEAKGESLHVGKAEVFVELDGAYTQALGVAPNDRRFLLVKESNPSQTFVFHWFEELRQLASPLK